MESSNFGQRALVALSVVVIAITFAASWWVVNPKGASELANSWNGLGQPQVSPETDGAVVDEPRDQSRDQQLSGVPSSDEATQLPTDRRELPIKLAAFEQPPTELPPASGLPQAVPPPGSSIPGSGLRIPSGGVSVPAASPTSESAARNGVISYKGVLFFVHDVSIPAQADGVIQTFNVDEGSLVEKDAVMVEIDNRLAKAEQEIANKELESALLKAEDESQIKFSVASEEVARSDFKRTEDLYKKEVANIDEYERKRLEWIKSQFSIDVAKREQKINQAAVGVSEAKLNAAGVQVELRTIRAPFTGIVAKADKEELEWVKAGDEILRLVSLDSFRVKGRVRIADSPNILERAPARVMVQVKTGQVETVEGVVGFIEPETPGAVDGKNEYTVWVEIPNRVVGGQYLFRGKMDATVEIFPNR